MLSKNKIKFINSIKKKKYREIHNCFFVEGEKLVDELIYSDFQVNEIFATSNWINDNQIKTDSYPDIEVNEISENELKKISSLTTPNKVLAIATQAFYEYSINKIQSKLSILLENISDPGNLGAIIRIADWFGIENIFCTNESVDVYNPKVVQASMGAIFRVKTHCIELKDFFSDFKDQKDFNIYGTFLEGNNIYSESLDKNGVIVMGNESHGISDSIKPYINKKLFIPNYPNGGKTSESLNISVATAIVCSEFRRRV